MASIDKRPSGRWRARYRDPAGRQHARHFERKVDAQRWLDGVRGELARGAYINPDAGRQAFVAFAVEWANAQDWKDSTREGFPAVLARLESALPNGVLLRQVDQLTIKRVRVALGERYATATVDLTVTYLTAIMRAAFAARRIGHDPTVGTQSRRRAGEVDRVGPDDIPTRSEVAEIWQAAPAPYRAAIALGATGLRVGEVLGMSADRLDLDARLVTIDRQMQRLGGKRCLTTPKGEKVRTIRVPGAVALELRRHLRDHDDGLLFTGRRTGEPMRRDQFYDSAWRPALVGAGLARDRFVFHSLRHFAASSMLAEGVNPMAVAGHLGDTLETLQRVYAHWMRDDLDVPADALDRILDTSAPDLADQVRTAAGS